MIYKITSEASTKILHSDILFLIYSVVEIIPSINVPTFEEVQARIRKIEPYVSWCHLDVTDGVFSKHPTWRDPADLSRLDTKLKAEVHLMIEEPEKIIDQWLVDPIRRVIVHLEACRDIEFVIEKCREAGKEVGLAINPETFWGKLQPWFGKVDLLQVLAVSPGPSGQKMGEEALDKIRHLRSACVNCIIEADGGINAETAVLAAQAGADLVIAGSFLFSASDIQTALSVLQNVSSA